MSMPGGVGGMPGSGHQAGMGSSGTAEQQLVFLNTHWGSRYSFTAPAKPGGRWMAVARFGQHDQMDAQSAAELLVLVRDHYQVNRPDGGDVQ
jgi:hypothetical protein